MSFIEDEEAFGVFEQGQTNNDGIPLEDMQEDERVDGQDGDMDQEEITEDNKGRFAMLFRHYRSRGCFGG